jgi:signal transduction histidine kinase
MVQAPRAMAAFESRPPRVLLVDDAPANLLALSAVLAPIGAEVVEARSGPEAINLVLRDWYAAILIDVQMPGMDGFETAERIRATERGREVPILFLTAIHFDESNVAKGYDVGAADYITKPFDIAIVRARVRAFVDLFRQRENQRRERLETALNFAPALVWIVGVPGYVCEFANVACRQAFKDRNVVGSSMTQLGATAELIGLFDRVAALGESLSASEQAMPVSSGAVATGKRVFDFTLQPLRNDRDCVEALVVFAIDVTDQVRSRKQLELAREQAERASQAKDDFLAIVSHELRTPLSSVLGWAVLARRRSAPVDAGRAFEVIERNARTQARLVDDILDMSRIIGGKLRLDVARTDLGRVIASAVDSLRPAADAKGVTLSICLGNLGEIEADADRIQQVVWNLLSNAIKFTTSGGRAEVTASRRGSRVVIRVDDTGEGIESASIPDLFRPFWQADTSTTRRHGGLGLGLAIASQIAHAHGGTITATSEGKGKGTSMIVELAVGSPPAAPTSRTRISRPVVTREPSFRLDELRVLVVDDDEDARHLLNEIFADRGARVTCASSAFEALEELRRGHPDVVVSDIGMPGMDGFTLMRAIRQLPRDEGGCTPAIALTAHARADDVDRALAAGFQLHASKPVDPMALVESVASLAGRSLAGSPG